MHLSVIRQERNYEITLFSSRILSPPFISLSLSFPIYCCAFMEKHGTRHLNQSSLTNEDEAFQNVSFHIRVSAHSIRCVLNRRRYLFSLRLFLSSFLYFLPFNVAEKLVSCNLNEYFILELNLKCFIKYSGPYICLSVHISSGKQINAFYIRYWSLK